MLRRSNIRGIFSLQKENSSKDNANFLKKIHEHGNSYNFEV